MCICVYVYVYICVCVYTCERVQKIEVHSGDILCTLIQWSIKVEILWLHENKKNGLQVIEKGLNQSKNYQNVATSSQEKEV